VYFNSIFFIIRMKNYSAERSAWQFDNFCRQQESVVEEKLPYKHDYLIIRKKRKIVI
jgi:hypothetical protein